MHKKRYYIYLFFIVILITAFVPDSYSQNYKPVWSDEFDGTSIDLTKWGFDTGGGGWGNNELENYTNRPANAYIQNGCLVIKAIKESYGGMNYTSARLKTQGKFSFKYGKIEASMRLPYGKGIWPAFWMLGDNITTVSWPKCGELDIMEMVGGGSAGDRTTYGTAHWDANGHKSYGLNYALPSGKFSDNFHVFSMIWDQQKITWQIDGKQFCAIDITPAELSAFQNNFFIILNLAVGGNWPGSPDVTTIFPQTMEVDYVRVYKMGDLIPDVTVSSPENFSSFPANSNIKLAVNANVVSGVITNVEFYQDAMKIGETAIAPYEMNWKNVAPGNYKIKAKAYSTQGYSTLSETVNVIVGSGFTTAPYGGTPARIPGIIETENFDMGASGKAYFDSDELNSGSVYRTSGVDIEACSDTGSGYNIGWIADNEWLLYTVNVKQDGTYQFIARTAATVATGKFQIEIDGVDVTGVLSAPNTGGTQKWVSVASGNVTLKAGTHTMKFFAKTGGFNLNKIDVYPPSSKSTLELITPNGGESYPAGSVQEITWSGYKVANVRIGFSSDGGANWTSVVSSTNALWGAYRWKVPATVSDNCKIMILDKDDLTNSVTSTGVFKVTNSTSVEKNTSGQPEGFMLEQNFPNPFNPSTSIRFSIPKETSVSLKVYDILGREIKTIVNDNLSAGNYNMRWNGEDNNNKTVAGGAYLCRLTAGGYSQIQKMILQK